MSVIKIRDKETGEFIDIPALRGEGGVKVLTVTITDDVASHTSAEIYAHVQSGGTAVLNSDWHVAVPLMKVDENVVYFGYFTAEESFGYTWIIYDDGSAEFYESNYAQLAHLSERISRPATAKVGQTIVVKSVDANGKPTAWEAADLPGSGIVVAKFYSYDDIRISCSTHTAQQLCNILNNDEKPVIAYVHDENTGENITAQCWTQGESQIYVGEPFGDNGWMFDYEDYNQDNFANGLPDHTIGNQLWMEI